MTVVTDTSTDGHRVPPEPDLTEQEIVARAARIAATLVDRQQETEQRGYYGLDTHKELLAGGFYRILVPRRYGGYEFGIDTHMRVVSALARGCPSTAWMYTFGASHAHLAASLFGEEAQNELFAAGDFICPGVIAPAGLAEQAEGGWLVDGVFRYSSGSPYATHFIGQTFLAGAEGEPPTQMMFVVPRDQWRRLDDWGAQLGLKGSGSHSIKIEKAYIPDHYALVGTHMGLTSVTNGTPGLALHGNRLYGGSVLAVLNFQVGALAVGMATGALDAYSELMRERMTTYPPIVARAENPDYQLYYGEADGRIAAARAAMSDVLRQWGETAENGSITRDVELRMSLISREVVRLCWSAVSDILFPTAGSSAVRAGERLERIWRDMSTLHTHAGVSIYLSTVATRELANLLFDVHADPGPVD
ncbi:acyl-CoA dehydrogenase [Salinispora arenicola]|uniref:acyl-CoA dehydrogenase family protein n=1 Tax=Salinispora arenicola TaxID=168697 RepID=UPI000370EEF2|nr:acyl-CoA dehydrogenase family protein [Salinispora arenicola]NIL40213.1 acyl-CoA dehydrogenase [Salinispora arenicola]